MRDGMAGPVMKHACVGPRCDDAVVGDRLCAALAEGVEQFGFEFILVATGVCRLHRAHVATRRDRGCAAHGIELGRILDEPHFGNHVR